MNILAAYIVSQVSTPQYTKAQMEENQTRFLIINSFVCQPCLPDRPQARKSSFEMGRLPLLPAGRLVPSLSLSLSFSFSR
jgi:hypothetical protein